VYAEEKNPKAALAEFEEVLQRQARRFETTKLVGIRLESAWVHQQIVGILDSIGKPVEAEASLRRAVSEAEQAIAVHPKNVAWQEYAFRARYMLAKLLKERGRPRDALPIYRTAATELEQVVTGKAGLVSSRRDSSVAWEKVAIVELELRELADAERDIRHAIALMTELAAEKPDDTSLVESAADQQGTLADILVAKGDRVGANAALTKALAQLDPVKSPKLVKTLRDKLARCCS
jgi:tetratricopeptide (TPR) repeat protein